MCPLPPAYPPSLLETCGRGGSQRFVMRSLQETMETPLSPSSLIVIKDARICRHHSSNGGNGLTKYREGGVSMPTPPDISHGKETGANYLMVTLSNHRIKKSTD